MIAKTESVAGDPRGHELAFRAAFAAVREARARLVIVRPHRAITPLKVTPYLLAQALVLPALLCTFLYLGKDSLFDWWRQSILLWSHALNMEFSQAQLLNKDGQYLLIFAGGQPPPAPGVTMMAVTAIVAVAALLLSFRMKGASLPLKFPFRIAAVIQIVTLLYFWLAPGAFPYSIARHSEELMSIGFAVMLATPVMLAVGYYILNQALVVKIFNTALILLFMAVMVPHQVLAQAFIMQHMSVLFMPVLYICLGAVFDALVFVALYSWAVSNAPAEATV